jgi:hypothetical protein
MGGACRTYGRRGVVYIWFRWGNLMERDHLGDLGIDERIILKWIFKNTDRRVWIGLI